MSLVLSRKNLTPTTTPVMTMAVTTAHVTPTITCFLVTRDFLSAFESACSYTNTSFLHTQIQLTSTKRDNNIYSANQYHRKIET